MRISTVLVPGVAGVLLAAVVAPVQAVTPVEVRGLATTHTVDAGVTVSDPVRVLPAVTVLALERKAEGSWSNVDTVTPTASGSATVEFPAAELGTTKYRLTAAATPQHAAYRSPTVTIEATQGRGTISGWGTRTLTLPRADSLTQNLRATPAGARIVVQRRTCKTCEWSDLGSRTIPESHRVTVTTGAVGQGTRQFRVFIPPQELVRRGYSSRPRTVIGYGRVPPTEMIPRELNRLMRPLGMPKVFSDSVTAGITARASCAARELAGFPASRSQPQRKVRARWLATEEFRRAPGGMVTGVNVSVKCQTAFFVRNGKVLRAVPVSTGRPGYRTRLGTVRIFRSVNGVETSNSFPEDHWNMYRSLYFSGGQAVHGSYSDTYVVTYPASHGCVRMLHRDVDWLWRKGWTIGTTVKVYGNW
jgi:L,D-transpeptidase catalytic domain